MTSDELRILKTTLKAMLTVDGETIRDADRLGRSGRAAYLLGVYQAKISEANRYLDHVISDEAK